MPDQVRLPWLGTPYVMYEHVSLDCIQEHNDAGAWFLVLCSHITDSTHSSRCDGRWPQVNAGSLIPSYPLSLSVPIESRKPSTQTLDRPPLLFAQIDASLPAMWGEMQVIPLNIQIASLSLTGPGSPTSVVVEGPPRCITGLPRNENRGNRGYIAGRCSMLLTPECRIRVPFLLSH